MKDALLLVDVVNLFDHDDGDALLASFRERLPGLRATLARARAAGVPVVYVNDQAGRWDSDGAALVRDALAGPGGAAVAEVAPRDGDPFVLKRRYSALRSTPASSASR